MSEEPRQLTSGQLTGAITPHDDRELPAEDDLEFYQSAAETIFNSYPNAGIHDVEEYLRTLRETLLHFGRTVAADIADPKTGIITRCRFPPTVAELHEFANPPPLPANKRVYAPLKFPEEKTFTRPTAGEREEGYQRLKQLSADIRANAGKAHAQRKFDPRTQSRSHQAIRAHYGMPQELRNETHDSN